MKTAKFLISASIVLFTALAGNAHATKWKTVNETTFKGDTFVYQVKIHKSGAELVIDEEKKIVFLYVRSGGLRSVDGIKLDGVYYNVGGTAYRDHDSWRRITLGNRFTPEERDRYWSGEFKTDMLDARDRDLLEKIRSAKTIELNVYVRGDHNQIMKF